MKPENKALIKSLLDQSDSLEEDIYADTEQMLGTVPFILRTMARRPEFMIFSAFKDFYALRPKSLDAKTAELLALWPLPPHPEQKCLKVHMAAASRAGASQDEILDAVFIAAIIGQTRVLASALREFQDFEAGLKKEE